jgi:hypothetical protein
MPWTDGIQRRLWAINPYSELLSLVRIEILRAIHGAFTSRPINSCSLILVNAVSGYGTANQPCLSFLGDIVSIRAGVN